MQKRSYVTFRFMALLTLVLFLMFTPWWPEYTAWVEQNVTYPTFRSWTLILPCAVGMSLFVWLTPKTGEVANG